MIGDVTSEAGRAARHRHRGEQDRDGGNPTRARARSRCDDYACWASYVPQSSRSEAADRRSCIRCRATRSAGGGSHRSRRRRAPCRALPPPRFRHAPRAASVRSRWCRSIAGPAMQEEFDAVSRPHSVNAFADDHPLARLDVALMTEGRRLDLGLDEALLDSSDSAAEPSIRAMSARASCSGSSVSASMKYEPPNGSAVSVVPASAARICVRRAIVAARARSVAPAPRRTSSCAATVRRRRRGQRLHGDPRCCSPAAARSTSSRPSARGSARRVRAGWSRRSGRA